MKKLLLIDGHSVLSRAYYGVPLLTASNGTHTNAVFGFLNIILKCLEDENADYAAVAFDLERSKLKRTQMYPEYKGTRKPMPTELLEQVPIMREIVGLMGLPIFELTGYEADDLLGTAAKRAQAAGYEVTIVSGDRDLLQLCDEHIKILMPKTSKGRTELTPFYPADVKEKYSVTPEEFIDLKALMGDSSDNIPGLPGVGEKTATDIIVKFHSIENAREHADEVRPPRAQKALKEQFELAELSKQLATIDINAPMDFDPSILSETYGNAAAIYTEGVLARLRELELKTIAARFSKKIAESRLHGLTGTDPQTSGILSNQADASRQSGQTPQIDNEGQMSLFAADGSFAGTAAAANAAADTVASGNRTAGSSASENAAADIYSANTAAHSGPAVNIDTSAFKYTEDPFMAGIAFKDAAAEEGVIGFSVYADSFMGQLHIAAGLAIAKDRCFVIASGESYPAEQLRQDIAELLIKRIEAGRMSVTLDLKHELKVLASDHDESVNDSSNQHSLELDISSHTADMTGTGNEELPQTAQNRRHEGTSDPVVQTGLMQCSKIPASPYIHDISIAAYLIDPGRSSYEYDDIAGSTLGTGLPGRQELIGKKHAAEALSEPELKENAKTIIGCSAFVPFLAHDAIMSRLKDMNMLKLYTDIEMPLVYTLNDMENAGIRVDRQALSAYAAELKKEIDALNAEVCELAGEKFNLNSPKQLGVILFEKLGIQGGKKTKTGYSTAADVLEKLAPEHEIVRKLLRYRMLSKLYSTYAAGLDEYIQTDGRIHGTFNQTITATGRISSTDPNLQNIPVKTAEGKEIRKVFIPEDGFMFVDADYSQVELRILAALSGDQVLIDAYKNAVDIHTLTASQVFHTPIDQVTPEMRRNAKAVNFGIVYGISAFGLGEDLSISRKEANEYIEQYFKSYPKVKEYLDGQVAFAKEHGYVATLFGRVRPVPELKSSNFMQRSFGERIAMNSPIQGTAADIMKIAMNSTARALRGMKSRVVLQVHDELLIETAPDEAEAVSTIVKQCMEEAAELPVRLAAEVKSGATWYDCH